MKHLAIIIPTFNRWELLRTTLLQLLEQSSQLSGYRTTIIVVNDGCTDMTETMLVEEFPQVVQERTTGNFWYTKSINVGLESALKLGADQVLTLNDDIELKHDYLRCITSAAEKFQEPIVMGSTSVTYEKPHRITFSGVQNIKWWRFKQLTYHKYLDQVPESELTGEKETALLPGRGMLINAKVLSEVGLFEPILIQYASDDEFCYRARKCGFKVYVSWDSLIYSHHELTGPGTAQLKEPFFKFVKNIFNPYSRTYWKKHFFVIWNYGIKPLFPLTIGIIFLGEFYSYLKYRVKE